MKFAISLMNFECKPWGVFQGLSYHQEYEAIDPITFADPIGLGDRIKRFFSSNFMVIVR